MTRRVGKLIVVVCGLGLVLAAVAAVPEAWGKQQGASVRPQYFDRQRCGVVDVSLIAPRTLLRVDLDGDSTPEHYIANWGGVERHGFQRGTTPPTLVREAVVYTSQANAQYSCVDLRVSDVDGDGDLDLVFGGNGELVVLANSGGRLGVARREPQSHPPTADVRIEVRGREVSLQDR